MQRGPQSQAPPYRRRTPIGPRSSPTPWRPIRRPESGIPPDLRHALSWLGKYWFTLAVLVFVIVRAILRRREGQDGRSAGQAGGGLSLGLAGVAPAVSPPRGDDPLERTEALRGAIAAQPTDRALRLQLAPLLLDSGRYRDAIAFLRESVELAPADAALHLRFGEALAGAYAWDEALAQIETAIRLEPTLSEAHEALGDVLAEKHWAPGGEIAAPAIASWREASRLYEKRLAADPSSASLRASLGGVLMDAGDGEAGIAHLRRAARELPDDADVQARLAAALQELDRDDEAERQYRVAVAAQQKLADANPRHAGHHARLGDLRNEAGEDGDGDAWFDAALIDPDYGGVEEILVEQAGEVAEQLFAAARHLRAGRWREAADGFREVTAETPLPHAFCGLGEALLQLQRTAEARTALVRALELRPGWARPTGLLRQLPRA